MQWLANLSVRRAVFASVLMLTIVVVGLAGYRSLGVDAFPKVDFPTVSITTRLDGAAPEEVETQITDKIEAAVNTIPGSTISGDLERGREPGRRSAREGDRRGGAGGRPRLTTLPTSRGIDQPDSPLDPTPRPPPSQSRAAAVRRSRRSDKQIRRAIENIPGVGR
jgi:hypothetical protein